MIDSLTILLFFVYTWGFGFTATFLIKKNYSGWEKHLMNIGIGLGVFSILSIILNTLRVPLDWKIFFFLSIIIPLYSFYKKYKQNQLYFRWPKFQLTKSGIVIFAVLGIFLLSFGLYTKGAFTYPYLENSDPWGHSVGVKYVAIEKTAFDPEIPGDKIDTVLSYIDPYPPAYDILQGILHQTADDLNWSLKFFNALIISLGFIFFFFMAKLFLNSNAKALFATAILASVPAYLSHFIWAHSLVVTLFFPAIYCFQKARTDKNWVLPAILVLGGIWVAQNLDQPVKLTTMILIYLVVISIANRKMYWAGFIAVIGGMMLSQFWWMTMVSKYGLSNFVGIWQENLVTSLTASSAENPRGSIIHSIYSAISAVYKSLTNPGGTGSRPYSFHDFFIAKSENMINNPIGIGIVVTILVLIGLIYLLVKHKEKIVTKDNASALIVIFWLIFTFWGVNGQTFFIAFLKENGTSWGFSIARGPFRVWMLLAIPVSLVATEGAFFVMNLFRKIKVAKVIVMLFLLTGIIFTSTSYKYEVNTAIWPTAAGFSGVPEAVEYGIWFKSIPPNTKVFLYSPKDKIVTGFGGFSCDWCKEIRNFRKEIIHRDIGELLAFLKQNKYEYLVLNPRMDKNFLSRIDGYTPELLEQRYQEMFKSGFFDLAYQKEGLFIVLKVR